MHKEYPGNKVLHGVEFDVHDGEFMVIVGPSGCGKSTLLRIVAGVETLTSGSVKIGDREVGRVHPRDRNVAMVFQDYALYPHMSVERNLGFGMRARRAPRVLIREKIRETAGILGIEHLLNRKPAQLSGGERQRVALGRAMMREPEVYLMDEPLSNLDAALRVQMRGELIDFHRRMSATIIYVTHDQVEAMTMGDRIAVIRDGRFQQIGKPRDVYRRPANVFVARFLGSPRMNLVPAALAEHDRIVEVRHDEMTWRVPRSALPAALPPDVLVGFRPEAVVLCETPAPPDAALVLRRLDYVENVGNELIVHLAHVENVGTELIVHLAPKESVERIVARVPAALEGRITDGARYFVAAADVHLFDATSGEAFFHGEDIPVGNAAAVSTVSATR